LLKNAIKVIKYERIMNYAPKSCPLPLPGHAPKKFVRKTLGALPLDYKQWTLVKGCESDKNFKH
jgi:hypothetical protein